MVARTGLAGNGPVSTKVVAWGSESYGRTLVPEGLTDAVRVEGSSEYSLALKAHGHVVLWGRDFFSQARAPEGLSNAVAIAVGSFRPNRFGLFDLEGNAADWCEDFFDGKSGKRVVRWGTWFSGKPEWCSPSFRSSEAIGFRAAGVGFRIVLEGIQSNPDSETVRPVFQTGKKE